MASAPRSRGGPGQSAALACAALLCLACLALPALADPVQQSTGDSLELSDDKDFIYEDLLDHHSVVCPRPMCECRHVGSGGIAAKCSSLDFKGQRFQGVVSHFEVSDAPELDDGLFLAHNSLASLGLQFLTTVKIANSSLKGLSLSTFEGLTDLYDVDLSNNRIMVPSQDVFLNNSLLRKLSLRGNPVGVARFVEKTLEKSYLLNSASLNELDLSECELSNLSPHFFSRMKHLERLLLAGNKLRALHRDTLSWLTELEELDLSDNQLSALSTDMFLNSTELTELRLRNNDLHALDGVEILGLDELDVSGNLFEAVDANTFLGFPALTRLNLSNNAVVRVDPHAFESMIHLQDLDLSGNTITGPLPRELFATCEVLETLNLSDNPTMTALPEGGFQGRFTALYQLDLSYTSLSRLANDSFVNMDHLSILNLQGNQLTEVGAGVLQRLPQLVTLDLSDNRIATLDTNMFDTSGFLRHLDLSGNLLTTVSPRVFVGTPYLRWLDLSRCELTSLWDTQAPSATGALRKVAHLNLSGNQISTLRVSDLAPASGLAVLDIAENPLKCTKELHYLMEWLIKRSVTPRSERGQPTASTVSVGLHDTAAPYDDLMHGVAEEMMEDSSLRVRWAAVYDQFCGPQAFLRERAKVLDAILASSPATASPAPAAPKKTVTQEELDDIKMVLGEKKMTVPSVDTDQDEDDDSDEDSYSESEEVNGTDANVEDAFDDDADDDDEDEDEDEYDDTNLIADSSSNGTDYLAFTHRGKPYFWPVLTIGALLAITVLVVANVVVCLVRRRRARRHARFLSPMYRQLGGLPAPGQHKTFGGIPGSFIKTKKDGGFVYKKLYEDTTTPVFVPQPQVHAGNTFRFPLDPSDLQGPRDPQRV